MFVRNAWYVAAWSDEIGATPLARRICEQPLVLFRDRENQVAALEDRCCHRSAPLHMGSVVDAGLQCGYHGLVFDRSGRCVSIPAQNRIPPDAKVRSYPLVEKNQLLWIWMGDPAKADAAKIIDYPYHDDDARWPHKHAMLYIKAAYTLLIDNLMDNTHVGFVHRKTIGGDPLGFIKAKETLVRRTDGLFLTRWLLDSVPPPTYVKAVGFQGNVDRWQEFDYIAPSNVVLWTGAVDTGTGALEHGRRDGGFSLRTFNSLTPETEGSCLYFWSVANGYRPDDAVATEQIFQEAAATFLEDKAIVEGQQARLDELGDRSLIDIASDSTRLYMRRTLQRLLADDATSA